VSFIILLIILIISSLSPVYLSLSLVVSSYLSSLMLTLLFSPVFPNLLSISVSLKSIINKECCIEIQFPCCCNQTPNSETKVWMNRFSLHDKLWYYSTEWIIQHYPEHCIRIHFICHCTEERFCRRAVNVTSFGFPMVKPGVLHKKISHHFLRFFTSCSHICKTKSD